MQAKQTTHPAQQEQSNQHEIAESTVGYDQIASFEVVDQLVE